MAPWKEVLEEADKLIKEPSTIGEKEQGLNAHIEGDGADATSSQKKKSDIIEDVIVEEEGGEDDEERPASKNGTTVSDSVATSQRDVDVKEEAAPLVPQAAPTQEAAIVAAEGGAVVTDTPTDTPKEK